MMKVLRRPALVALAMGLTLLNGCCRPRRHSCCAPGHEPPLHGVFPTVLTPYDCSGLDLASLERQIEHELHGGVNGLLVLGTLGEGQYLSMEERAQVISTAVRVA